MHKLSARHFLCTLFALSLAILSLGGCEKLSFTSSDHSVPSFELQELSGKKTTQNDLSGKVVIVNFWATSCTTCVKEMPEMIKVFNEFHPQGLDYLAIAMSYDPPMYVMNYTKTRKLPFRVAMDSDGSVAKAFGKVELTPTTFVINKQGQIIKRYVGEPDNWDDFRNIIQAALKTS